jgi:hypothetical protein
MIFSLLTAGCSFGSFQRVDFFVFIDNLTVYMGCEVAGTFSPFVSRGWSYRAISFLTNLHYPGTPSALLYYGAASATAKLTTSHRHEDTMRTFFYD